MAVTVISDAVQSSDRLMLKRHIGVPKDILDGVILIPSKKIEGKDPPHTLWEPEKNKVILPLVFLSQLY